MMLNKLFFSTLLAMVPFFSQALELSYYLSMPQPQTQNKEQGTINQTSKLTDLQGKLSQVAEDLKKEGLPESLKSKLEARYQSISQEVSAEEEAIKQAQEASKTAQKQLSEEEQLNAVLSDPNLS